MLSFSQYDIFSQLLPNSLYNNVYSISSTLTYSTVYNYSTSRLALLFISFPFPMWYFSTITSQLTLQQYFQHILNIYIQYCLQLHPPSILTLLFIYASFSQYDIFPQLLHNWLCNNVSSISSTYTYGTVYNYTTQYSDFAVYISFLYTIWYFSTITAQLTLQQCFQHILNIYI